MQPQPKTILATVKNHGPFDDFRNTAPSRRRPPVWTWLRAAVAPSDDHLRATVGHIAPSQRSQMATWKSTTGSGGIIIAIGIIALLRCHCWFLRLLASPRPVAWVPRAVTFPSPRPRYRVSSPQPLPFPVVQLRYPRRNRRSRGSRRGWAPTMSRRSSRAPGASPGIPSRIFHPGNNCARYAHRVLHR